MAVFGVNKVEHAFFNWVSVISPMQHAHVVFSLAAFAMLILAGCATVKNDSENSGGNLQKKPMPSLPAMKKNETGKPTPPAAVAKNETPAEIASEPAKELPPVAALLSKRAAAYFVNYTVEETSIDTGRFGIYSFWQYSQERDLGIYGMLDYPQLQVLSSPPGEPSKKVGVIKYPYPLKTTSAWKAVYRLGDWLREDYENSPYLWAPSDGTPKRNLFTLNAYSYCSFAGDGVGWDCRSYESGGSDSNELSAQAYNDEVFAMLEANASRFNPRMLIDSEAPVRGAECFIASGKFDTATTHIDSVLSENRTYCFSGDGVMVYYERDYIEHNNAYTVSRPTGEKTILRATASSTNVLSKDFSKDIYDFEVPAKYKCIGDANPAPGMNCADYCKGIGKSCSSVCDYGVAWVVVPGTEELKQVTSAGVAYVSSDCSLEGGLTVMPTCNEGDLWKKGSFKCCCS